MNAAASRAPRVDRHVADGQWIEAFVAGTHTDSSGRKMTVTAEHLDELASSYDPAVHEAPVVVGHPKTDDPALGWVAAVKRDGNKLLYQETGVAPEFDEMRAAGRYKKRSLSFYLADSPGNPTPGKLHIRHVGWLGAMPPAVKGMADKAKAAAFQEDDGEGVVEFNDMTVDFSDGPSAPRWILSVIADVLDKIRDRHVEDVGAEAADRIVPRWQIDSIREAGLLPDQQASRIPGFGEGDEPDATDDNEPSAEEIQAMNTKAEELAAREAQMNEQQAALDARQREFDERARTESREAAAHFADQLVNAGKLLPAKRAGVVELLIAADAAPALSFGEGDDATEQSAGELLRELLTSQSAGLDFSEKSREGDPSPAADFAAPAGTTIDADRLAIHNKASAYQAAHPNTSYAEAVKAVGG